MSLVPWVQVYKTLFQPQRRQTLVERVQGSGKIDYTLSASYRVHVDAHEWSRSRVYVEDMKTAVKKDGMSEWKRYISNECSKSHRRFTDPATKMVFVDVNDGEEGMQMPRM
ncbi:hypothetical protein TRIATDRAFT_311163 [Trichoderma atroviride IMI 206040]|uniref:Uncharacterized protein n=1 Tax=Hypocrea atroviridis (strain ATCC 20476 / IMI 206040) TaxID=452589 RepID=G9P5P2_HYPAI|nr:uncharacterized protein TRIATDRAFT_311163 [Trichoderma atroviride IMI 206040]EHK40554.1 hypothetical protein TRIATDRAFT_311163 [Trichoderma atroviride IMI 206040]